MSLAHIQTMSLLLFFMVPSMDWWSVHSLVYVSYTYEFSMSDLRIIKFNFTQ